MTSIFVFSSVYVDTVWKATFPQSLKMTWISIHHLWYIIPEVYETAYLDLWPSDFKVGLTFIPVIGTCTPALNFLFLPFVSHKPRRTEGQSAIRNVERDEEHTTKPNKMHYDYSTVKTTYLLEVCHKAWRCIVLEAMRTVLVQPRTLYCTLLLWFKWSNSSNKHLLVCSTFRTQLSAKKSRQNAVNEQKKTGKQKKKYSVL